MLNTSKTATGNKMSDWSTTVAGTSYATMTVFDALRTEYNGSGYTVFDQYASENAKLTLARYIRDSAVGNALGYGSFEHSVGCGLFAWVEGRVRAAVAGDAVRLQRGGHGVRHGQIVIQRGKGISASLRAGDMVRHSQKGIGGIGGHFLDVVDIAPEYTAFDKPVYWSADGNGGGSALPVVNNSTKDPVNTNTATWVGILQDMGGNKDSISSRLPGFRCRSGWAAFHR